MYGAKRHPENKGGKGVRGDEEVDGVEIDPNCDRGEEVEEAAEKLGNTGIASEETDGFTHTDNTNDEGKEKIALRDYPGGEELGAKPEYKCAPNISLFAIGGDTENAVVTPGGI